jgi:hypothetical protein
MKASVYGRRRDLPPAGLYRTDILAWSRGSSETKDRARGKSSDGEGSAQLIKTALNMQRPRGADALLLAEMTVQLLITPSSEPDLVARSRRRDSEAHRSRGLPNTAAIISTTKELKSLHARFRVQEFCCDKCARETRINYTNGNKRRDQTNGRPLTSDAARSPPLSPVTAISAASRPCWPSVPFHDRGGDHRAGRAIAAAPAR